MTDGLFVVVKMDSYTLASQLTGQITLTTDAIEVTNKNTNRWKLFIPGEKGGTVSVSGLLPLSAEDQSDFDRIYTLFQNGAAVRVEIYDQGGDGIFSDGIISSFSHTSAKNNAQGYSLTINLTGIITEV